MNKITIKGLARTVYPNVQLLDGIRCDDDFVEYNRRSDELTLKSGYMRFECIDGQLYTITEYIADRELTNEEMNYLEERTVGQWSDGIGESFEQFSCAEIDGEKIYISPWFYGQTVDAYQTITQEIYG